MEVEKLFSKGANASARHDITVEFYVIASRKGLVCALVACQLLAGALLPAHEYYAYVDYAIR